ncbi:MAG: hypothetical protein M0004_14735 [Actinomycetota bacterium]|nr:hypothetical protein [Actinomycetota bacterium]
MGLPAEALLSGPRGRRLCWIALDEQSFERTGRYQLRALEYGGTERILPILRSVLAEADLAEYASSDDVVDLLELVANSVDSARYWQEPDEIDAALTDPELIDLLAPVAEAIARAPASTWWSSGLALGDQVLVERREDGAPPPRLKGAPAVLAAWKARALDDEVRLRGRDVSGVWWSSPTGALGSEAAKRFGDDPPALNRTTRSLPSLGAVGLLLEEDSFGTPSARCWPLRASRAPRVFEVRGEDDWRALTERYPIEVTFGRRGNWDLATGRSGRWVLADWSLVAEDYDAVHLSALAYLATSGRALSLSSGAATLIAGWNADETYWLADVPEVSGAPSEWVAAEHHPARRWQRRGR